MPFEVNPSFSLKEKIISQVVAKEFKAFAENFQKKLMKSLMSVGL